jgi:hypothetical protein
MIKYVQKHFIFFLITVIVILYLFPVARSRGLFLDEFFSLAIAKKPITEIFFSNLNKVEYRNSFPPLFELVVKGFKSFCPVSSDLCLRMPSLLSFIGLLGCVYALCLKLFQEKKVGIYAIFFIALNPSHLFFAQMMRGYIFLAALIAALMVVNSAFFSNCHKRGWHLIAITSLCIAIEYTFYVGFSVLLAEYLVLLFFSLREDRKLIPLVFLSAVIVLVAYIPWIPGFIRDFAFEAEESSPISLWEKVTFVFQKIFPFGNISYPVHGVLFLPSCIYAMRRYRTSKKFYMLLVLLLICIIWGGVYYLMLNFTIPKHMAFRAIRYILPVFFIPVLFNSFMCVRLQARNMKYKVFCWGLLLFTLIDCAATNSAYKHEISSTKEIARYLKQYDFRDASVLLFIEDVILIPGFIYYFRGENVSDIVMNPYFGGTKKKSDMTYLLEDENYIITGNIFGIEKYVYEEIEKYSTDFLVLIDSRIFMLKHLYTEDNEDSCFDFINETEAFLRIKDIDYSLVDKQLFTGYACAVYKREK